MRNEREKSTNAVRVSMVVRFDGQRHIHLSLYAAENCFACQNGRWRELAKIAELIKSTIILLENNNQEFMPSDMSGKAKNEIFGGPNLARLFLRILVRLLVSVWRIWDPNLQVQIFPERLRRLRQRLGEGNKEAKVTIIEYSDFNARLVQAHQ